MRCIFLSILSLSLIQSTSAQKHDNVWTFGYNSIDPHPDFGGTNVTFDDNQVGAELVDRDARFKNMSTTSISNASGELRLDVHL